MNMQESDFRRALEIITRNNRLSTSNATVLKELHEAGYSLLMTPKGLCVMKY